MITTDQAEATIDAVLSEFNTNRKGHNTLMECLKVLADKSRELDKIKLNNIKIQIIMTKEDVKNVLSALIDSTTTAGAEDELSSNQLTELTDAIANEISETVNPNGPCYPSTPR